MSFLSHFDFKSFLKSSSLARAILSLLVLAARFIGLPPNFSPIGGYGFTAKSLVLFYLPIVLFDWQVSGFYTGFIFTYLGFFSYFLLGRLSRGQFKKQLLLLPIASFLFFLISNFGVWLFWYPQTLSGLLACYLAAIPFYGNTLMGDLVFGTGFILLYKITQSKLVNFNQAIDNFKQPTFD